MAMADYIINNDYLFAHHEREIIFPDDKPVVLGYVRVSTAEQEEDGASEDVQMAKIREGCVRRFGTDAFHIVFLIEDARGWLPYNRGGMKKGTYREGLTLATQLFATGRINYLGVYKVTRLLRLQRIWHELDEDFLRPNDVEIFSAMEPVSNRTGAARFVTSILAASSEFERENIVSGVRDGMRERARNLYHMGIPPFGWQWDSARAPRRSRRDRSSVRQADGEAKIRRNIEPDPDTSVWVRRAYDWHLAGKTRGWIAEQFESGGVKSPQGATQWTAKSIGRVLRFCTHAGLVRLEGELVQGRHYEKRIVEPAEYFAACEKIASQARIGYRLVRSTNHVFGEFVHCALCGKRMRMVVRPKGPSYECRGRGGSIEHDGFGVPVEGIEKSIVESIAELARHRELIDRAAGSVDEIANDSLNELRKERVRLTSRIEATKKDLLRWCERWNAEKPAAGDGEEESGGNDMVFELYKDKLLDEIADDERRLREIRDQERSGQARVAETERALAVLERFDELWENMDSSERRTFAGYVIEELTVRPDGNWADVNISLLLGEPVAHRVLRRGRYDKDSTGIEALTRGDITLLDYFMEGFSESEIAEDRRVAIQTVRGQKYRLMKRLGVESIGEALELGEPIVAVRKEEVRRGLRRGQHFTDAFTPAQVRHLELIASGASSSEIAGTIGISVRSVHGNATRLYRKLGVHSAGEAVAEARRRKLIPGNQPWSSRPTPKQTAVLIRLAKGFSQPEVARDLDISLSAVKERVKCMFAKLGVRTRVELLALASERRWV